MIALWRFEERADLYRDSSGNGYTLFPGGDCADIFSQKTHNTICWIQQSIAFSESSRQVNYNMGCPKTRPAVTYTPP